MNKVHYKMFKAGKKWMVAGIVTMAMSTGAFFLTSINANADVISNASGYTGTPYAYGGTDGNGIDCSALVQNAYAADGVSLPRTSGEQYGATTQISAADAQPGDLVFFGNQGSDHVGIYSGNGNMINAETIDGVTSRQVSVMERYLGAATYGRVNGANQFTAVNSNVADTTPSNDNAQTTDTAAQTPSTTADNQTNSNPVSDTTTPDAPVANDATPTDNNVTPASTTTTTTDTTPVAQTDAPATTEDTDANKANAVQNDNIVTLDKTAPTPAQSTADASTVAVAPATTTSDKKAALPATGEANNSLLSIIGLVLTSFVAMFGIKFRKNN